MPYDLWNESRRLWLLLCIWNHSIVDLLGSADQGLVFLRPRVQLLAIQLVLSYMLLLELKASLKQLILHLLLLIELLVDYIMQVLFLIFKLSFRQDVTCRPDFIYGLLP